MLRGLRFSIYANEAPSLGVVKVVDSVVASGKRFERRFDEGEATILLDSGRIEQNRRCYSGGAPHPRSRFASTRFACVRLFLPAFALHQRALRFIKLHQDRIVVRNPQQKRLLDLGWSNLTRFRERFGVGEATQNRLSKRPPKRQL